MRQILKKASVLALVFMLGAGNFAYASSAESCQEMKAAACCEQKVAACECKLTPLQKLYPQLVDAPPSKELFLSVVGFIQAHDAVLDHSFIYSQRSSSKSPPGQIPLFALYSSFRI